MIDFVECLRYYAKLINWVHFDNKELCHYYQNQCRYYEN